MAWYAQKTFRLTSERRVVEKGEKLDGLDVTAAQALQEAGMISKEPVPEDPAPQEKRLADGPEKKTVEVPENKMMGTHANKSVAKKKGKK